MMADPEGHVLEAAAKYLADQGISVFVIGDATVQHQPEARKLNHELVIKFTGILPDKETE